MSHFFMSYNLIVLDSDYLARFMPLAGERYEGADKREDVDRVRDPDRVRRKKDQTGRDKS
ncbi:hypothetical protein LXL04_007268 [Taraxacum kok-saghyz]